MNLSGPTQAAWAYVSVPNIAALSLNYACLLQAPQCKQPERLFAGVLERHESGKFHVRAPALQLRNFDTDCWACSCAHHPS
jgi:hypothetical protein